MGEDIKAFPVSELYSNGQRGMYLRDWFAGQCDVSAYNPVKSYFDNMGEDPTAEQLAQYIAALRFIEADAMLAERAKAVQP